LTSAIAMLVETAVSIVAMTADRFIVSSHGMREGAQRGKDYTGLCRQSVALGLARLEAAGVLRIVRQRVARLSPFTGKPEVIVTTTQASNLYAFSEPAEHADHLPVPAARKRAFPTKRQLALWQRLFGNRTESARQALTEFQTQDSFQKKGIALATLA
jgi:hypothetical protein